MPIGKNAIKRVADSTKKETLAKAAAEVAPAPKNSTAKKPAAPKTAPKATAPKAAKPAAKKPAAPKAAPKAATAGAAPEAKNDAFNRINIGGELPIYLL